MNRSFRVAALGAGALAWLAMAPAGTGAAEPAASAGGERPGLSAAPTSTERAATPPTTGCAPARRPTPQLFGEAGEAGAPPPERLPSTLLDAVSGGVFGSPFWPNPSRVPGSGPLPGGAGQGQSTRRDPPGAATGSTSSLTLTGSFQ